MEYTVKQKRLYKRCQRKYIIRKIRRKLRRKLHLRDIKSSKRYGRRLEPLESVQETIFQLISSGEPFMVGRMGGVESSVAMQAISVEMELRKDIEGKLKKQAQINAGFFPSTTENLMKFSGLMQDSLKKIDILGSSRANNEEFLINGNMPKGALLTDIGNLEPYYATNPWSRALVGKKVLVIHPFSESIARQYLHREKLFKNANILPEFDLYTLKAVQSIAGTKTVFNDWFEALEYMYNEAMKIDFDIAIIGCGAYGFPLAAKLKQAGKQAIHLGGATQILFGVWGSRWDSIAPIKVLKNEYWIRPSEEETPQGVEKVEGACYW